MAIHHFKQQKSHFWCFKSKFVYTGYVEIIKRTVWWEKQELSCWEKTLKIQVKLIDVGTTTKKNAAESHPNFPERPQSCSHSQLTALKEISDKQIYHSSGTDGSYWSHGISTQMLRYISCIMGAVPAPISSMVPHAQLGESAQYHNAWLIFFLGQITLYKTIHSSREKWKGY